MLLGTPMPKAVRELLQPGVKDGKQPDSISVLKKAGDQPDSNSLLKKAGDQSENFPLVYYAGKQPDYNSLLKKAGDQAENFPLVYYAGKQPDSNSVLTDSLLKKARNHSSKAKVTDHDCLFFLESDLTPGRKINVNLRRTTIWTNFLPRQLAEAIPFSTDKVTQIMEKFSIKPHSPEANVFKETIKYCEDAPAEGEEKHCATSLESMVDFVVYKLGRNVQSLSTEIGMSRQQYTSVEEVGSSNSMVCHSRAYAYPVFQCHTIPSTKVYKLHLDTKLNKYAIIAVCHFDTSKWNPEYIAFKLLNVKPGTTLCHFLTEGNIVWTSDGTSTST